MNAIEHLHKIAKETMVLPEIGDYVRTECGIAKIKSFETKNKEVINLDKDIMICNMDCYRNCCTINQVIKSSPNIIDLIEVGDYVNGKEVIGIQMKCDGNIKTLTTIGYDITNEMIKSIVTKEQFENMQYIVESDKQ